MANMCLISKYTGLLKVESLMGPSYHKRNNYRDFLKCTVFFIEPLGICSFCDVQCCTSTGGTREFYDPFETKYVIACGDHMKPFTTSNIIMQQLQKGNTDANRYFVKMYFQGTPRPKKSAAWLYYISFQESSTLSILKRPLRKGVFY